MKFGHRLKHLVVELIPPATFFFISFQLLALSGALMSKRYGIETATFLTATIAALVVAKVVLLTNLLPIVNRFPRKPILYNIVWKTTLYFAAACVFRYAEKLFHAYRDQHSLAAANHQLLGEVVWPQFWLIQLWLTVLLLIYVTLSEIGRVLGPARVRAMFFGAPQSGDAPLA
jgi:hypothetical protein